MSNSSSSDIVTAIEIKTEPTDDDSTSTSTATPEISIQSDISSSTISVTPPIIYSSSTIPIQESVTVPPSLMAGLRQKSVIIPPPHKPMGPNIQNFIGGAKNLPPDNRRHIVMMVKQGGQLFPAAVASLPPVQPATTLLPPPPLTRIPRPTAAAQIVPNVIVKSPPSLTLSKFRADSSSSTNAAGPSTSGLTVTTTDAPPVKKFKRKSKTNQQRKPGQEEQETIRLIQTLMMRRGQSSSADDLSDDSFSDPQLRICTPEGESPTDPNSRSIQSQGYQPTQLSKILPIGSPSLHAAGTSQLASTSKTVIVTPDGEQIDEHRWKRMKNNEAVRRSRMKARLRVKQSEMNCRLLVKQFGELKEKITELEKQLAWEKRKNEILEEMLRRSQLSAAEKAVDDQSTANSTSA